MSPDARRVPGPNLFAFGPGAAIDATWAPDTSPDVIDAHAAAWRREATALTGALGWPTSGGSGNGIVERRGASLAGPSLALFLPAPLDQLETAVAIAEAAWTAAATHVPTPADVVAALLAAARPERDAAAVALVEAADARGLLATIDDEGVSIGGGARSRTWPRTAVPAVDDVDWNAVGNIPVALVTGSNGKTTVARVLAAMLRAAGHTVGVSTTDGVRTAGPDGEDDGAADTLEVGDWAGPGGARRVLRDARVTAAVLETARGGLLRRGLAVRRATVAVVTNVAADHLGEYGIDDLADVAEAKLIVARALRGPDATLVLPADDRTLADRGAARAVGGPFALCWTLADPADAAGAARVAAHVTAGGRACAVRAHAGGDVVAWHDGGRWTALARVVDIPLAAGGRARHNVANAVHATAVALALGVSADAVRRALATFGTRRDDNPGRLDQFTLGGVTVVIDYAHNPDGLAALHAATRGIPAERRALLLGQAGDRDDAALDALAVAAWGGGTVDHIVLKELPTMARGRAPGAVRARLRAALIGAGAPESALADAESEFEGVRAALAWARPGDLLLLPLHEARDAIRAWFDELARAEWRAGSGDPRL